MSSTFILKKINVSQLDKTHVIPDMVETSFKTSPRNKKTKIKDILEETKKTNTLDDDNCEKIVINHGINKILFYTTIGNEKIEQYQQLDKPFRCYHCHSNINKEDSFIGIPVRLVNGIFECIGITCGFECAASHIKLRLRGDDSRFRNSDCLLSQLYFKLHGKLIPKDIANRPMFAYEMLESYGGPLKEYGKKIMFSTRINKKIHKDSNERFVTISIQPSFYEELKK